MADNYLERKRRDYEERKAIWLKKKKFTKVKSPSIQKPEDEAL
ncbi:dehydrogenase [Prevotella sp.]